jgi:Spy/CpxP family protein refolding chaperone
MNLRWNQIAVGFLVGLLAGAIVGGSPYFRKLSERWDGRPPHNRMLNRFAKRLQLSEEQKAQVGGVLEQGRAKMDAVFKDVRPRFEQVRKETDDEIRAFLNPEQRQKFEKMNEERARHFNKRFPPSRHSS